MRQSRSKPQVDPSSRVPLQTLVGMPAGRWFDLQLSQRSGPTVDPTNAREGWRGRVCGCSFNPDQLWSIMLGTCFTIVLNHGLLTII